MEDLHTFIGDQGVVEKKDVFGKTVIIVCMVLCVVFVVLGALAIINP